MASESYDNYYTHTGKSRAGKGNGANGGAERVEDGVTPVYMASRNGHEGCVARLVARMMRSLGVLKKGHLVEVTRCIEEGGAASSPGPPASSFRNRSLAVKQGDQLRVECHLSRSLLFQDPKLRQEPGRLVIVEAPLRSTLRFGLL